MTGEGSPEGRFNSDFVAEVKSRTDIVSLVERTVRLRPRGREQVGLCPFHHEKTPSFTVVPHKGFFHCFGCGASGDSVMWLMKIAGLTFPEAIEELAINAGMLADRHGRKRPDLAPKIEYTGSDVDEDREAIEDACKIWSKTRPIAGSIAERYLRTRGIFLDPLPPTLRYMPDCPIDKEWKRRHPAMVAAVQGPDRRVTAVHRTFLARDGKGKAGFKPNKMGRGKWVGGAIRLGFDRPVLGLAEGIETALSVMQHVPEVPVWPALSLTNIAGGGYGKGEPHPEKLNAWLPTTRPDMDRPGVILPDTVREVLILEDANGGDMLSQACLVERAANRFRQEGRVVWRARPPEGTDFNDLFNGKWDAMQSEKVAA